VSMLLYLLGGWLLLNVLFAVGMYFRPKRKKPLEYLSEPSPAEPGQPGESASVSRDRASAGADENAYRPAMVVRLLLFGLWLNDRRHSV